uniref:acetyl-CoA carboxylase beta subunit n=1 Tax=Prosopanche panguanensis TaxID=2952649 RepID=UPI002114F024|nr:acetyl-CoA carboxylase beta subunit [Prosopanche panguanensis]USN93701.1 acetyl-CoA carboxylase beta subunit [Prosopanche panguanensis]
MSSSDRIQMIIDKDTWNPLNENIFSIDPLDFDDTLYENSIYTSTLYGDTLNDNYIYDDNVYYNSIDSIYNYLEWFFNPEIFVYSIDLRNLAKLIEDLLPNELKVSLPFTKEELKQYLQEYSSVINEELEKDLTKEQEELEEDLLPNELKVSLPFTKEELKQYLQEYSSVINEELEKDLTKEQEELEEKRQRKREFDIYFVNKLVKIIELKKLKEKKIKENELYVSFGEEVVKLIENQKQIIENELKTENESKFKFYEVLHDTIDNLLKEKEEEEDEYTPKYYKAHYNLTDEIKKDLEVRTSLFERLHKEVKEYEEKNELENDQTFNENFDEIEKNKSYINRLNFYREKTSLAEAVNTGIGKINGIKVALGIMDSEFMGGSMGSAVGEKLTRLIEYATQKNLPIIIFCASGGARIQEGICSLIQMSKISAALHYYKSNKKSFFISILTSPTAGGVIASFGMLGDIIIAEPNTTIAFAGQRIIEQILNKEVPKGFQTAEYLFKQGAFDLILPRQLLKTILTVLLNLHGF